MNTLNKTQENQQSNFRVHFYLKNVYYSHQVKLTTYLQEIAGRISKHVSVSIIQVFGSVRKILDLSIGLKNDEQACYFMESKQKIYLPGQYNKIVEHQPLFSQSFKAYYKSTKEKTQKNFLQNLQKMSQQQRDQNQQQSSNSNERNKQNKQESSSQKYEEQIIKYNAIFILCIPLEVKEKEVINALAQKQIIIKYYEWKYKEDMEYLHIQLAESLTEREIFGLDIRLDKYPLLILPKCSAEHFNSYISKFQLQLNFQKDIDEIELMKTAYNIGGVLTMIKDDFYGPRKYIIAFNTLEASKIFEQSVEIQYKFCKISKPRIIVRLCRLQKTFTFSQLMDNLSLYEQELKRINPSPNLYLN